MPASLHRLLRALGLCLALAACQAGGPAGGSSGEADAAAAALDGYVLDDPSERPADGARAPEEPDASLPQTTAAGATPPANGPEAGPEDAASEAAETAAPAGTEVAEPQPEAPEDTPDVLAPARAACEAEGGIFGRAPGGAEARICFRRPEDANTPCRTGAECEGACLARSRTCAPIIPLLGCNEVILSGGRVATECIQ